MSGVLHSALFYGHVTHMRVRPKVHKLAYRIYSLLIDLDELADLDRRLHLFSVGRFNLFSFYPQDRGDGSARSLREQVERSMSESGIVPDGGPIRLLTMPRLLGWAFNPLSIFFCYSKDGGLRAILWEVDNTFGERHGYMIPVEATGPDGRITQRCSKQFYVSPFMDLDLGYSFEVSPPGDTLAIRIDTSDRDGLVLRARHLARRRDLTDAALLKAFVSIPFLTLRVVGGIHWEALKIWRKGISLRRRPSPPLSAVSVVPKLAVSKEVEAHEPV